LEMPIAHCEWICWKCWHELNNIPKNLEHVNPSILTDSDDEY